MRELGASGRSGLAATYALLGMSAGMPFSMVNAVLLLRLARHEVDLVVIGFFGWVALVPTLKFAWAWMIDRWQIPGFSGYWSRRQGWILLAQTGIVMSLAGMALTASDNSLSLTALFAVQLALWSATLEIAADGWRIELAPDQAAQAPLVTANLWGYRGAMVAAASAATLIAAQWGWVWAYGAMAILAAAALPLLLMMPGKLGPGKSGQGRPGHGRTTALLSGLGAALPIIAALALVSAGIGHLLLGLAARAGIGPSSPIAPVVMALCLLPFLALTIALPRIRRLRPEGKVLSSSLFGPYADLFWRYGSGSLVLVAFVATYRLGDVMTLTFSHPEWNARGYSLEAIAMADGLVALAGTMAGVALGGWLAARWAQAGALAAGGLASAIANWAFVWLWHVPVSTGALYAAAGIDQFGHAVAATVFVVFLSTATNPRFGGAQYAFLSGLALMVPRLVSGGAGGVVKAIGYDGFFLISGALSLAPVLLLPFVTRLRPRA